MNIIIYFLLAHQSFHNYYNINNVSGLHIGQNYTVNINQPKKSPKADITKTPQIDKLMGDNNPITREIMLFVSTHVGEGWRDIGRELDYSDGQIEQLYEENINKGIKEVNISNNLLFILDRKKIMNYLIRVKFIIYFN